MPSIPRSSGRTSMQPAVKGGIKIGKRSVARAAASRPKSTSGTNAKGDPLTFDVTGGEAHEVKGYDALMELHDINP